MFVRSLCFLRIRLSGLIFSEMQCETNFRTSLGRNIRKKRQQKNNVFVQKMVWGEKTYTHQKTTDNKKNNRDSNRITHFQRNVFFRKTICTSSGKMPCFCLKNKIYAVFLQSLCIKSAVLHRSCIVLTKIVHMLPG